MIHFDCSHEAAEISCLRHDQYSHDLARGILETNWAFVDLIFNHGKVGSTYNLGGNNEICNIEIINQLIALVDSELGRKEGYSKKLITYVTDRLGHDYRYAIDSTKIEKELGWTPKTPFHKGLEKTVISYLIQLKAIS